MHAQSPRIRHEMGNVFPATKLSTTAAHLCHTHRCIAASVSITPKAMYYHNARAIRESSFKGGAVNKQSVIGSEFLLYKSEVARYSRNRGLCKQPDSPQQHWLRERTGAIRSLHATTEARRLLVSFGRAVSVWSLASKSARLLHAVLRTEAVAIVVR